MHKKRWIQLIGGAAALMLVVSALGWVVAPELAAPDRMAAKTPPTQAGRELSTGKGPAGGAAAGSAASNWPQMVPQDPEKALLEVYVSEPSTPTISPAVRDLPEIEVDPLLQREMMRREYRGLVIGEGMQGPAWLDPLVAVQGSARLRAPDAFTTPLTNWAGMDYNSYPPDTTGDIGPNHYVQAVNGSGGSTVQIFNKSGTVLKTFTMDSLSSTAPCNNGYCDPIVVYDSLADRWLITEFSATTGYAYCLYVSTTADPTGTWYAYTWDLPYYDYPKYGVWRDAYYMGYNGGPSGYVQVFAFDRAKMLAGQTATYQMFNVPELSGFGFQLLVPASWEGPTAPPAGLGGLFARPNDTEVNGPSGYPSTDFLEMYEFDVDFTTPANSTLTELPDVAIGEYDATLCGTGSNWACMDQPNGQGLDPIREPLHQPLQYRNWGSYDTLVGGFAEDVDGADTAAVRWFELRRVSGAWSKYQEGVVGGGDASHRSVTSVAMDGGGGIGLGYTLTSSTIYPSIRYAGRRAWDAPGTMTYVDVVAQAGTGSQASYDRWGDYSGIGIDPSDDCTFWYTTEYMSGSTSATRVISFRHDADFSPDASPNTLTVCQPSNAVYTVQASATCAWSGAVTMSASGLPGGVTASWGANPVTPPGSTTLTIGNTGAAAVGSYNVTISGTSGGATRSETVVLNISSGAPLGQVSLSAPADGTTGAGATPTLSWAALAGATSYDIQVATDPGFSTVVRSATGLTGTSYMVSPALGSDTVYYWRVNANNACGTGSASVTWAFRTAATSCLTYASTDVPKTISDNTTINSNVTVPATFSVTDVNVTIGSIVHTWDADLDIYILHPDATQVELSTDNGSSGDNYTNTVFDDEAASSITSGSAPFTGSYRPEGSLAALDGKTSAGAWQLRVTDDASGDTGTLNSWSLTLCGAPTASAADYSDLASSYGVAWHTGSGAVRLGPAGDWDTDISFADGTDNTTDTGVERIPFTVSTGGVNLTVTGATGWVTGWFDWNQDGDFSDAGEQVFTNQQVNAGSTTPVSFNTGVSVYGKTFNARFRVYTSAQTLGPDAAAAAYGGATDGEVEDYTWIFSPQAVDLASFTAEATAEGVTLAWETVSEIDNAGFNVYRATGGSVGDRPQQEAAGGSVGDRPQQEGARSETGHSGDRPQQEGDRPQQEGARSETGPSGEWVMLNAVLIPALTPGSAQGNAYTWIDAAPAAGTTWYMLEDVSLDGVATQHEPVSVTVTEPNAVHMTAFSAAGGALPALGGLAALALAAALRAVAGVAARKRR